MDTSLQTLSVACSRNLVFSCTVFEDCKAELVLTSKGLSMFVKILKSFLEIALSLELLILLFQTEVYLLLFVVNIFLAPGKT